MIAIMIQEHDRVVLTVPLSDHGFEPGDVGVVVHVYPRHEAYEVEFVTLAGRTEAIVTASADQIRPISKHEIPHARELAHP
jgi:hypothetical protein